MGGFGSGRWSKQRSFSPEFARVVTITQEGPPARPLSLDQFHSITAAFFREIGWRPFLCSQCGAYKLGPTWLTACGLCEPSEAALTRSAFGREEPVDRSEQLRLL